MALLASWMILIWIVCIIHAASGRASQSNQWVQWTQLYYVNEIIISINPKKEIIISKQLT
jgi:hypothetical protein